MSSSLARVRPGLCLVKVNIQGGRYGKDTRRINEGNKGRMVSLGRVQKSQVLEANGEWTMGTLRDDGLIQLSSKA